MDYFKKGTAESNAKGKARSRTPRTRNPMFADDDDDDDPDVAGSPPPLGQARGQSALDRRPMTQFGRNLADDTCPPARRGWRGGSRGRAQVSTSRGARRRNCAV